MQSVLNSKKSAYNLWYFSKSKDESYTSNSNMNFPKLWILAYEIKERK